MSIHRVAHLGPATRLSHELHFTSLYDAGRGFAVPCDEHGHVDLDSLSERHRTAYLGARAMIGREYLYPKLRRMR
jgi:hypothetical protein